MKGKRVLVTGSEGFLGRHVVAELQAAGAGVQHLSTRECDLRQPAAVRTLLGWHNGSPRTYSAYDLIIHLAARVGGIGANQAQPATFFYDNLMMGLNVLHEAWQARVPKVVVVGTICAYPKHCPTPFQEADLWNGYPEETNAPYGIAKKALSVMSQAYRDQHGFNSVVVYPTNLYGPYDNFDPASSHVIPALLRKFHDARRDGLPAVTLWGTGQASREFLYVSDCARAIRLAAERYDSSAPLNLGSGSSIRIADLARLIAAEVVGYEGEILFDPSKPDGQPARWVDSTLAREHLGWEPEGNLRDGLRWTYGWARSDAVHSGIRGGDWVHPSPAEWYPPAALRREAALTIPE